MLPYVFGLAFLCFIAERLFPGWPLPRVKTWPIRVILINLVQLSVILLAGVSWEKWLSSRSLFHLGLHVSPELGGLLAYFLATFMFYWGIGGAIGSMPCGCCSTRCITVPGVSK